MWTGANGCYVSQRKQGGQPRTTPCIFILKTYVHKNYANRRTAGGRSSAQAGPVELAAESSCGAGSLIVIDVTLNNSTSSQVKCVNCYTRTPEVYNDDLYTSIKEANIPAWQSPHFINLKL